MARSKITAVGQDLIDDSGSVLFSFIKGEQLEFPVDLEFVSGAPTGYTFEAVVVEGANEEGQTEAPGNVESGGIQTNLTVRVPVYRGVWAAATAYDIEDVVLYSGKYYRSVGGIALVDATPPDTSQYWRETAINRVYVQFLKNLAASWNIAPAVGFPVYGFFELRVTEPDNGVFQRTWKPVRGLVQILFSPTDIVPDV